MKLQYLSMIFLIIILPIVIVLSQYIDYNIDAIQLRQEYDKKLISSTYDALKSYQLNTVNNAVSDIPASKIDELEAAVNVFLNSVSTSFGYMGYNAQTMKEYIPAIVFTLYDGYYIYSPFENILTGVQKEEGGESFVDESYLDDEDDGKKLYGLKPYVYYSCRYKIESENIDIIITYTLDNYITIQGNVNGIYWNESGYLVDGIEKYGDKYIYEDIEFDSSGESELKEYLGSNYYSYIKLNGTKYYLDTKDTPNQNDDEIFYINTSGEKTIQASKEKNAQALDKYATIITNNNSAYRYYKESYEFTKKVRENLYELKTSHAVDVDTETKISEFGDEYVFGNFKDDDDRTGNDSEYIQDKDSIFNMHRSEVIRYVVTKNLSSAISGYKNYYNSTVEYIMPKISETDWEIIENNVSIITFLQGFKIAGGDYNEYCVIANNLTKEYIDENDIYILCNDNLYYKPNDSTLDPDKITTGIWKLNFERRVYKSEDSYGDLKNTFYFPRKELGSYSSIINSTSVDTSYPDLYKFMRASDGSGNPKIPEKIRETYYTALARERWGQYSVNKDIDILKSIE